MADILEIVSKEAIQGIYDAGKGIVNLDENLLKLQKNIDGYKSKMQEVNNSTKELNEKSTAYSKILSDVEREQMKINASAKEMATQQRQIAQTEAKLADVNSKSNKELIAKKLELQKAAKSTKDLIAAQNAQRGSTDQLIAVNKILESRLRGVNQTTEKGKQTADRLRSAIDKNNAKITQQSSAFTATKRGIGEYSKGIQDAVSQTGLFSRELAVINKIQATLTLLLGKKAAAQNASTAATTLGTKAMKIFKVALASTGIGLLLVALGSLVAFFKSSEEGAAALQRILSPFKILFGNLKDLAIKFGGGLVDAFKNPKEAVVNLWESIKKNIVNRITGLIDTFKFLGATISAAFNLDFDGVKENAAKAGESYIQSMTGVDDAIGKARTAIKGFSEETKKENEQNKKLVENRLALLKQERDASIEQAKLEVEIQNNRLKLKDEENYTNEERLAFAQKAQEQINRQSELENDLAKKRYEYKKLENSFSTSSQEDLDEESRLKVELINVEAANAKKRLRIESEKQTIIRKINTDAASKQKALAEQQAKEEQALAEKQAEEEQALAEQQVRSAQIAYDQKIMLIRANSANEEEYVRKKLELDKSILQSEIDKNQQLLEISEITGSARAKIQNDIAAQQLELDNLLFENRQELMEAEEEKEKEAEERRIEGINRIKEASINTANEIFNFRSALLDRESTLLEQQKESGLLTEQEYAKKKAEIERKQAKTARAQALFGIAINTAQAVSKIWAEVPKADFGVMTAVLTGLAIANGALQAGAVLSQPLPAVPAFAEGTHGLFNTPSTFIAGEAGTEIVEKNGKSVLVDKPTIFTNLKGARVRSNPETEYIMNWKEHGGVQGSKYDAMMFNELKGLRKDIKNMPQPIIQDGRKVGVKQNNHTKKILNLYKYGRS